MRWCDVDQRTGFWTISQTKTNQPHTVPLPRQALTLLREQPRTTDDGLVFVNNAGSQLTHWNEVTKKLQRVSGTTGWHRHDLRRTAASLMGDMGVAPHVIEIALNHVMRHSSGGTTVGRIAAVYNRSRYRAEHADALQRLADELDQIVAGEDADIASCGCAHSCACKRENASRPVTVHADSALARLAQRLALQGAIGPPCMGPQVLVRLLEALHMDGWRPPKASQAEGGQVSGDRRRGLQTVRRIAIGVIMDSAPDEYRSKPRSRSTHEWAHEELQKLSTVFGVFSVDTVAEDIADWAYNPTTGTRRRSQAARKRRAK